MPGTKAFQALIDNRALPLRFSLILLVMALASGCDTTRNYQHQYLQFGTIIDVSIYSDSEHKATRLFGEIDTLLNARQRDWHGWRDGELKRFNDALQTGQAVPIPSVLNSLIHDSRKYHDLSGGLFNPAIGKLVAAWGFHASEQPDHALVERIKSDIPGMHDLHIKDNQASTDNPHLQLDFGAIAKGLGVREIARLLSRNGVENYIINAGGDVFAMGRKPERAWRVGIENPFQAGVIASMTLSSGESIFTSGNYHRYHLDNGKRRHHIIDPRTGEPSRDISAATVVHHDPVIADIAATTLMLTPIDELPAMARKLGLSHYLVIDENRQARISRALSERIEWTPRTGLKISVASSPADPQ